MSLLKRKTPQQDSKAAAKIDDAFAHARKNDYEPEITDEVAARKQWDAERFRAQTDLFWLAKDVLGYDLVHNWVCPEHPAITTEDEGPCPLCELPMQRYSGGIPTGTSPHRQICDSFVKKDPTKTIPNQDTLKKRILMCPRGSFKSSINEADTVQWIIAFPDIRIGLLTAAEDLAINFVSKIKSFFQVVEDGDEKKQ